MVTGDCKDDDDPTTEAFESVPCDVLIIESTFGLPIYHWPEPETVLSQINDWWATNAAQERTSVVMTYAVGKAQRLLAGLDPNIGPIGIHGALVGPTEVYRAAGIELPETIRAGRDTATELQGRGIIVCPPSAAGTPWIRRFSGKDGMETAFPPDGWRSEVANVGAGLIAGSFSVTTPIGTDCSTSFATARPNAWASPTDQPRLFRAISKNSKVWRALSWAINAPPAMETTDEALRPACS